MEIKFLNLEKSEDPWNKWINRITPIWFKFIEWLALIALLYFSYEKTHNWIIYLIFLISQILATFYFKNIFIAVLFYFYPMKTSKSIYLLFCLYFLIGIAIVYLNYYLIFYVSKQIK